MRIWSDLKPGQHTFVQLDRMPTGEDEYDYLLSEERLFAQHGFRSRLVYQHPGINAQLPVQSFGHYQKIVTDANVIFWVHVVKPHPPEKGSVIGWNLSE